MKFDELIRNSQFSLMKALKRTIHVSVAGVIVENEGKFLLVEEKSNIFPRMIYRKWNFPMERMKKDEKPHRCALRSGRKETGLLLKIDDRVRPSRKKNSYRLNIGKINLNIHLFEASIIRGELKVSADLLGVQFFSLKEMEQLGKDGGLVHPYILSAIADYERMVSKRKLKKGGLN